MAVMVEGLPSTTAAGEAEQLTVGGSKAFTVNCVWQSALSPGLLPTEMCPWTV
jgi:hypothetical protein